MQRSIDWQAGKCDFESAEFISLLETAGQITEHPETTEFTGYTPPEEQLRTGETYVEAVHVGSVTALRDFEERVGQALSFVGMPTPDGSNGSVVDLSQPVGVLAGGEHPDGCAAFLKFLLLSYDLGYGDRKQRLAAHVPPVSRAAGIGRRGRGPHDAGGHRAL